MFGNWFKDQEKYLETILLAKCVSLNSINFDFNECVFSKAGMSTVSVRDKKSKAGAGRVGMQKATGLTHCYTIEANYWNGKRTNILDKAVNIETGEVIAETPVTNNKSSIYKRKTPAFTIELMEDLGAALLKGVLDFKEINPISRLPKSRFKDLMGVKQQLVSVFELKVEGIEPIKKEKLPLREFLKQNRKGKKGKGKGKKGKRKAKKGKKRSVPDTVLVLEKKCPSTATGKENEPSEELVEE